MFRYIVMDKQSQQKGKTIVVADMPKISEIWLQIWTQEVEKHLKIIKGFLRQNSNFLGSGQQYITFCINCWQIPHKYHNCWQLWKIVDNCPQLVGDLLSAIVSNCHQSGTIGKMRQLPTIANNSWQSVLNLIADNCPQLSTIIIAFWSCLISMSYLLFNLSWILLDLVQYCYTLLLYL